jgi:ankyrin repeat protein
MEGVREGFNQLHLTLTVSPIGDVTHAEAGDAPDNLKFWPQIEGEVYQWKFTPFEKNGKPVTAEVEEYVDLVPPEQLPKTHIAPPVLKPDSKVSITLERSGCMGDCPGYTVTVSNQEILFDGGGNTVASGLQTDKISSDEVHKLAERFVAADFFSMWPTYSASVTDCPTYILSINVDGNSQKVVDYMGQWVGMPAVIAELEDEVDSVAGTKRWIEGSDGLVQALQAEKFNFHTFEAQVILKASARRGQTTTVHQLLEAGTPIKPLPAPKPKESYESIPFEHIGFLTAASSHPDSLQVLIDAGASKEDQNDKNSALIGAAESGKVSAVKALIGYGANPNADLSKLTVTHEGGGMIMEGQGAGSVLIYAAASGNPEMIREILKYNPHLEARDREGKTAIFAAGTYEYRDEDGVRVECVRILAKAGANINAKDNDGNTPLHETFLTDVEEELLKLGANVNARNNDGETPIFTTVDNDAIPLFIEHGADLTIRNNKGETVVEAAKSKGPYRQEALRKAIQALNQP